MTSKEKYRTYCKDNDHINIFQQPWWLDAVCGEENWDVCIAEEQGMLCGVLPYCRKKKLFFSYIIMPHLTLYFNPILHNPYTDDIIKKQSFEKKIIDKLINQLPQHDWINLQVNRLISWQPFYWKGFQQTTRYVYTIKDIVPSKNDLLKSFSKSARRQIRKAENDIHIQQGLSIEQFYKISKKTFDRQNKRYPFSFDFCQKLMIACKKNNKGEILYATDRENNIHAVLWFVWDKHELYFLSGGGDPKYRNSGAKFLIYQEAIMLAAEKKLQINCSGSMIENIAYVFRQLGASPSPIHSLYKINSSILRWSFFLIGKKPY